MAEFNFYGCWQDSLEILTKLAIEGKFRFFFDKHYDQPEPTWLNILEDGCQDEIESPVKLGLWSSDYSIFPLAFESYAYQGKTYYEIKHSYSGPALSLLLPANYINNSSGIQLGHGWASYPSVFYHPRTLEPYTPPETLKSAFTEIKKTIKAYSEKRYIPSLRINSKGELKPIIETLWIGKKGLSLIERGEAMIFIRHDAVFSQTNLAKNRSDLVPYLFEAREYYCKND